MKGLERTTYLLIILALILLAWIFWPSRKYQPVGGHTDTMYVDRPIGITRYDTAYVDRPYRVDVYRPDTAARAQAERQDIMTGLEYRTGLLTIEKLTPRGVGIKQEYHLPELAHIQIDGTGQAIITEDKKARHKRWWKKVGTKAAVVGAVALGFLAGRL